MQNKAYNHQVEEISWEAARQAVHTYAPALAETIDAWSPGDECTLLRCRYAFGDYLVKDSKFYLPSSIGEMPADIQEKLSYSSVPLGVIVKNGVEVFSELNNRAFPLVFMSPGLGMGIWESFDPPTSYCVKNVWDVVAGARTMFMLPKISYEILHKKICRTFDIKSPAPKNIYDQWALFKEVISHVETDTPWECEIIFFTKAWFEKRPDSLGWVNFYNCFLEEAWRESEYMRNKAAFDMVWRDFAYILDREKIRANHYLLDVLKHLVFLGTGVLPGYMPAAENTQAGPVQDLQKIWLDVYTLKDYVPTVMCPQHFTFDNSNPAYFSLHSSSLMASAPNTRKPFSFLEDLRQLVDIVQKFKESVLSNELKIKNTKVYSLINKIQYDYFHTSDYVYGDIKPTSELPEHDARLLFLPEGYTPRKFAESSLFLRGCVRIGYKDEEGV